MKTFKQFLLESKLNEASSKYKEGDFGYWWVEIEGNEDIEGKVYDGDIDCSNENLTSLKGAPKEVKGDFICNGNNLTSLKGCPEKVGGYFDCVWNKLTSLKGAPKKVDDDFWCFGNKLTSLEGCPKEVGGGFRCDDNKLTSLKGCPEKIGEYFNCSNNNLTSLEGAPKEVKGNFDCSYNNQLTSLEGAPKEVGGNFDCTNTKITSLEGIGEVKGKIKGKIKREVKDDLLVILYKDRFYNIICKQNHDNYTIQFENGDYKVKGNNFEDTIQKFYKKCSKYEDDLLDDLLGGKGWNDNELSKLAKKVLDKMV